MSSQALLANFHNSLLVLCDRLRPFFALQADFLFGQAAALLSQSTIDAKLAAKLEPMEPGKPSNNAHANLSAITKSNFWQELTVPLTLFCQSERGYFEMSFLLKGNEDQLKYSLAQVSVGIKKIMAALEKAALRLPKHAAELTGCIELLRQARHLIQCRLTMIPLFQSLADATKPPDFAELVKMSGESQFCMLHSQAMLYCPCHLQRSCAGGTKPRLIILRWTSSRSD